MTGQSMTLCVSHSPSKTRDLDKVEGLVFRRGLRTARDAVAAFDPTMVVFFGTDHRRAFQAVVPSFSVVYAAESRGDFGSPTGSYRVPAEHAEQLASHLITAGFDIAVTREVSLDHGFGQTAADVLGGIDAVPVLPVFINCASPPLVTCGRAVGLGKEVGRQLAESEERVLYIGSGGLSHSPPSLASTSRSLSEEERREINSRNFETAKLAIRPDWDAEFLRRLQSSETGWAESLEQAELDRAGVGANEVRTWLAAWAAGGAPLTTVAYEPVPEWITGMGIAMSAPSR
jgi:2,3-dihydroxyphenylpropionate 1,2-dioxygenase